MYISIRARFLSLSRSRSAYPPNPPPPPPVGNANFCHTCMFYLPLVPEKSVTLTQQLYIFETLLRSTWYCNAVKYCFLFFFLYLSVCISLLCNTIKNVENKVKTSKASFLRIPSKRDYESMTF